MAGHTQDLAGTTPQYDVLRRQSFFFRNELGQHHCRRVRVFFIKQESLVDEKQAYSNTIVLIFSIVF